MKPVWRFVLHIAEAILSAVKTIFGGNSDKPTTVK